MSGLLLVFQQSTITMWPFSAQFPEKGPQDVDGKEYDYVVIGGKIICILLPVCFPSR
jgi:hypothetical protein